MAKVKVSEGWLEGEQVKPVIGENYYSFKGIPYALPPLGKLRFKAPQPPQSWEGIRKATSHGPICPQRDIFTKQVLCDDTTAKEDCLYLNVYSPDLTPKKPLPVMFFIHGGGYKSGSGNENNYAPDFLVNHGVVLVTINYRLEVFGFLCLDIEEVPGNAGMKDQVAALKWVKNNIHSFGGDPNNITVFGESAGGASTSLHAMSPMSKGLFQRAIPMSGVPLCDFSIAFEPVKRVFALGRQLGLDTNDPYKLLEFLQNVPPVKLVDVSPYVLAFEEATNNIFKMFPFTPVVEKDFGKERFLPEDPEVMLKKGKVNEVDMMIGHTSHECLLGKAYFEEVQDRYRNYPENLCPRKILIESTPKQILAASEMIHKHYFGNKPMNLDIIREVLQYLSDSCMVYDIGRFVRLFPKNGKKKYQYRFSCISERNVYTKPAEELGVTGASHLEDLMYIFDAKQFGLPVDKNSRSYKMIQQTCALFTNFAKYGNPTPDSTLGVTWPEYEPSQSYLDINETLTVSTKLADDVMQFWKSVYAAVGIQH